jgi:hypothetical protein
MSHVQCRLSTVSGRFKKQAFSLESTKEQTAGVDIHKGISTANKIS